MSYRFCHRCQAELPAHDDGTLIFCTHCGAPQVQLSEELKDQLEAQAQVASDSASVPPSMLDARARVWRDALHCVALAAAIAAGLGLASVAFAPVLLIAWLWAVISPVVVIGVFQARSPLTPITMGFGARLGLVTGLAIAVVLSIINTCGMAVARRMHMLGDFDAQIQATVDKVRTQIEMQPGGAPEPFLQFLALPEFRAWFLFAGLALATCLLLTITTAGGAFAGFLRGRSRA